MDRTTILVAVDASTQARSARELATRLAGPLRARVVALHVVELPKQGTPVLEAAVRPRGAAAHAATLTRTGDPSRVIRDEVSRRPVDLLVLGAHGQSAESPLVLGSVVSSLIAEAPCPIICVSDGTERGARFDPATRFVPTNVVIPYDVSPGAFLGEGIGRIVGDALGVPVEAKEIRRVPGEAEGLFPWLLVNGSRQLESAGVGPGELPAGDSPRRLRGEYDVRLRQPHLSPRRLLRWLDPRSAGSGWAACASWRRRRSPDRVARGRASGPASGLPG